MWENIEIDFKRVGCESVDYIQLYQVRSWSILKLLAFEFLNVWKRAAPARSTLGHMLTMKHRIHAPRCDSELVPTFLFAPFIPLGRGSR